MLNVYALNEYGEGTSILLHEKDFTQEEFEIMCKEAPIFCNKACGKLYSAGLITRYLIETYEFIDPKYQAEFDVDQAIE